MVNGFFIFELSVVICVELDFILLEMNLFIIVDGILYLLDMCGELDDIVLFKNI